MKKHIIKFSAFAALVSIIVLTGCSKQDTTQQPVTPSTQEQIQYVDNQYIVTLSDAASAGVQSVSGVRSIISGLFQSYGISESNLIFVYEAAIKGFCAKLTPAEIGMISKDSRVSSVEQDRIIRLEEPIVTYYNGKESQIQTQGQNWGVNYVGANITADFSNSTRKAWIIDTGIDDSWRTADELNIQTSQCTTFVSTETWPDQNGHGTHVSGIIGAKNNSIGAVGVAPGAKLVAVKVLDYTGSGTYSGVIAGVNYVAVNASDGDVANMSLGGGASSTMDNAVVNASTYGGKHIRFCLAAGNNSRSAKNYSPARANGTYIFTISAFDVNGRFASFSNYGNPPIDFSGPGVSITSTVLYASSPNTASWSGTSMATPFATGVYYATGTINWSGYVTNDRDRKPDKKVHF